MFQRISTLFLICLVSIAFGDVMKATADTDKKILQLNLKYNDLTAEEYAQAVSPLAGDIAAVDGLLWKVWIINEETQEAGGIHLFEDEASLNAYLEGPIVAQLTSHPNLSDFSVKRFDVMVEPTAITRGPIGEKEIEEDFSNVFFMSLDKGLNMISLPLKPQTPYTARSFADEIGATVIIALDEKRQRFVGFTLDAPDDGFPIKGGKGYIVNVAQSKEVAFVGAAWTNQPPVEAAPSFPVKASDNTWAFVISGRINAARGFDTSSAMDYLITVRNTRTNAIASDRIRSGYFAAAFADLSRQSVVEVGDRLEVTVMDGDGEQISDRVQVTVTPETIRQASVPIEFTSVFNPRQNLLLQNYPNPFNPETWIPYQLQDAATVVIQIYDARGGLVRTLNFRQREAGFYQSRSKAAYWDGKNDAGEPVASGVYFYRLSAKDFSATRRMLIVK